ncbi:Hypothetical protein R9X50_00208100 [Acrodontium crateriforme]|uniref:N-acetyltransferase domain-containing protein n=1 Tax=Acrodontium crateriforme TaxID=150365 RepID=A0AAQ3M1U7_9PEZI|nr:Hypothetical protein R9X50_00208100 [Acrodontium crateriforme]
MPLQLSHMSEADIPEFVEVDDLAMGRYAYAKAMVTEGQCRKELIRGFMRVGFKQDDSNMWVKVVDTQTNELIAAAMWKFHLEAGQPIEQETPQQTAEVKNDHVQENPSDKTSNFWAEGEKRSKKFKAKFVGSQAHADLSILFTHPQHQRRGAASMLIKWGCDQADKRGIISTLHASSEGYHLYLKHGFELVEETAIDLRSWSVNETTIRRAMIRQPKKVI